MNFGFLRVAGNRDAKCCSIQARRSNNRAVTSRLRAENNTFRNFSSSNIVNHFMFSSFSELESVLSLFSTTTDFYLWTKL